MITCGPGGSTTEEVVQAINNVEIQAEIATSAAESSQSSAIDSYVEAMNAQAEAQTSDSRANEPEDVEVKKYYFNVATDEILYNSLAGTFSSLHWSLKAGESAIGLDYQGTWDASGGAYPTTKPPEGTGAALEAGDLFIVVVNGTISGVDWFIRDWMIRNITNDGWNRVPQVVDWEAIMNVPENVSNALSRIGGTMAGQVKGIPPVDDEDLTRKDYVDDKNETQDAVIALNTAKKSMVVASTAEAQAGTNDTKAISPLKLVQAIEGGSIANIVTAFARFDGTSTPPTIISSFNILDIQRISTGLYRIFGTELNHLNVSMPVNTGGSVGTPRMCTVYLRTLTYIEFYTRNNAGTPEDHNDINLIMIGGK